MSSTYRAALLGVDPDIVHKSVRLANGFRSWSDPTRELFQLGTASIEVHPYGKEWAMLVNAGSVDEVRDTVARLGWDPAVEVTEIKPEPVR
jgi:hypothetical protein